MKIEGIRWRFSIEWLSPSLLRHAHHIVVADGTGVMEHGSLETGHCDHHDDVNLLRILESWKSLGEFGGELVWVAGGQLDEGLGSFVENTVDLRVIVVIDTNSIESLGVVPDGLTESSGVDLILIGTSFTGRVGSR